MIRLLELTSSECSEICQLLDGVFGTRKTIGITRFISYTENLSRRLPKRVIRVFSDFKRLRTSERVLVVRGLSIEDGAIGRTPASHRRAGLRETVDRYSGLHIVLARVLGEPFGWTTIQNGYIVNDVMPVLEHREQLSSSGSFLNFDLHTEDAFTPLAGEFLGLLCLRNPDSVPTTFSSVPNNILDRATTKILRQDRFIISANVAHNVPEVVHTSAIMFGPISNPSFRVNLNATRARPGDPAAQQALDNFRSVLLGNKFQFVLTPGDFCYIDNLRVAHARDRFKAHFDGADRWLKRLYIASTLDRFASHLHSDRRVVAP